MTIDKDWKRLIRERMRATGERYVVARRVLLGVEGDAREAWDARIARLSVEKERAVESQDLERAAALRAEIDALRGRAMPAPDEPELSTDERAAVEPLLAGAALEAGSRGAGIIGSEHLLLALLRTEGSAAARALDLDLARAGDALTWFVDRAPPVAPPGQTTGNARAILRRACVEAGGGRAPTTLHVLRALLLHPTSLAGQLLEHLAIDVADVADALERASSG